jgi:broad specificity phosphatase PhoE
MTVMKRISCLNVHRAGLLMLFVVTGWLTTISSAATIIVVRHAERVTAMTADALLSPAGEERARILSQMLKDSGIRRIYVTEVRRVQQTAEPTAAKLHLKPVVIPQKDVDELVKQLKGLGEDETVLVVGHTNTVPVIIERLGATVPPLSDTEYDRMLVVTTGPGKTRVLTLRYGNITQ